MLLPDFVRCMKVRSMNQRPARHLLDPLASCAYGSVARVGAGLPSPFCALLLGSCRGLPRRSAN